MQSTQLLVFLLLAPLVAADHFGPHNCVSVTRSAHGSCVLKTECKGIDTSAVDFAFSCYAANGKLARHSFGHGGFDEEEEYDTEVKCHACTAPSVLKREAALHVLTAEEPAKEKAEDPVESVKDEHHAEAEPTKKEQFSVANYGPNKCISTYLSKQKTCIVKMECEVGSLEGTEAGLVCADDKGGTVRHVFGQNSFEDKEVFDTLIPCAQCLALDNFDSGKDTEEQILKAEVETLKKDVHSVFETVQTEMNEMESRVLKLEKKEEQPKEGAKPAEESKTFLAQKHHHHHHNRHAEVQQMHKSHHHHHHRRQQRHRREEEEDQDASDESEGDDTQQKDEDEEEDTAGDDNDAAQKDDDSDNEDASKKSEEYTQPSVQDERDNQDDQEDSKTEQAKDDNLDADDI